MRELSVAARFVQNEFVGFIDQAHGSAGTAALRLVLRAVISTFRHVEPESLSDPLVVFAPVEDVEDLPGEERVVEDYSDLQYHRAGWLVIEAISDGTARVWSGVQPDLKTLSETSVVYVYEDGADHLLAKGSRHTAPQGSAGLDSWFARPVFTDLRKALSEYRTKKARTCRCHTLKGIWREEARLILKSKPEGTMRDSLEDHLVSSLRDVDVEVNPEFVVDASHPVDIRVMFHLQNRVALIEIKWMGLSAGDGGITRYSSARARAGARQLARYLDQNRERAGNVVTKGYLVVIDGRRRGLRAESTSTTAANAMYYADKEVKYSPEYHNVRRDFAAPIRMFVEPASVDS